MLPCQKHKFSLPEEITYLNCAYLSPLLQSVEAAGIEAVKKKRNPASIVVEDFFEPPLRAKQLFAGLIDCEEAQRIAIIPSASYGIATVVNNLVPRRNGNIILIENQFPSHVYAWQKWAAEHHVEVIIIKPDNTLFSATDSLNHQILSNINQSTIAVAIGHVHWADGRIFDLQRIREKTKQFDSLLVIDGTQSVGALPFSVKAYEPDALIVAAYKWLLGPYSFGFAYFNERFDNGRPIEENWINRKDSEIFQKLVNYQVEYKPFAHRYNVGENSNFIAVPMTIRALEQLHAWGVPQIQKYTAALINPAIPDLEALGCKIEEQDKRASHLFGITLPSRINMDLFKQNLTKEKVHVSFRGDFIRVSPHLYNTLEDIEKLKFVIENTLRS